MELSLVAWKEQKRILPTMRYRRFNAGNFDSRFIVSYNERLQLMCKKDYSQISSMASITTLTKKIWKKLNSKCNWKK